MDRSGKNDDQQTLLQWPGQAPSDALKTGIQAASDGPRLDVGPVPLTRVAKYELLKEIGPRIKRVALLFNPQTAPGGGSFFLRSIEAAASSLAVDPVPISVADAAGIERGIDAFVSGSSGGLFVMPDLTMQFHQELIVALAKRHRLPAVYSQRVFVSAGGLIFALVEDGLWDALSWLTLSIPIALLLLCIARGRS